MERVSLVESLHQRSKKLSRQMIAQAQALRLVDSAQPLSGGRKQSSEESAKGGMTDTANGEWAVEVKL